jgi:hypothetical protein
MHTGLNATPKVYQEFVDGWANLTRRQALVADFTSGRQSFIPYLLPVQAVGMSGFETLDILRGRYGEMVEAALDPAHTNPAVPYTQLPVDLQGPVANQPNTSWLQLTNMVGINVRTLGNFWNIVKYSLTLPAAQDSIHILPIWEAGVAGSMYGISSWNLNPEFFSSELATTIPSLDTIEKQLRAVVNLLHLMGRSVGMDVIPHTDRFSQIALAFPENFEWLQRQDAAIIDHRANLHVDVQRVINEFLRENGPAMGNTPPPNLFEASVGEGERMRTLFGEAADFAGRETRRNMLIQHLYRYGFEPVPGTMAPPFRGLKVDTRPESKTVDANGMVWRDFVITHPEPMSRVFGPLGRYKLYERLNDNADWEVDFDRPRTMVWDYVCQKYFQMQQSFGFDFMRGDMSHVQMRPAGVPQRVDRYYDILGAVKQYIQQQGLPYFGYFAETFLAPRDVMGYGEEIDHLEAADADVTLGDLQSMVMGTAEFLQHFRRYYDYLETRRCKPAFTVMTADKDDPRFDRFYVGANEARLFIGLFLTGMPSYVGLGFETRDVHFEPAPNEHYTKLYVFQETSGPKATHGPYIWGANGYLYSNIVRMRLYLDTVWSEIKGRGVRFLIPPDAAGYNKVFAWTQQDRADIVFMVNTDPELAAQNFGLPDIPGAEELTCEFTTNSISPAEQTLHSNGKHVKVSGLAPGEGRAYRVKYA